MSDTRSILTNQKSRATVDIPERTRNAGKGGSAYERLAPRRDQVAFGKDRLLYKSKKGSDYREMKKLIFSILFALVLVLSFSLIPAASVRANPGIVGLWHFDEGTGTTAYDSSGNNNGGTLNLGTLGNTSPAAAWVPDQWGGSALSFDGVDDEVRVANEANFDFERTDPFTLSAWVKRAGASRGAIVSKMPAGGPWAGYQMFYNDWAFLRFQISASSQHIILDVDPTLITVDNWHHIAMTYDGSSDISGAKIYVNGVEPARIQISNTLSSGSVLNDEEVVIGARGDGSYANTHFDGIIDEVRIYNHALSAKDIAVLASPISVIEVEIDIKPGSDPNSINPASKGVIPVAILSTDTFNATSVDADSVRFGPNAAPVHYALEDVDGDGDMDMILHFKTQDTDIKAGDTEATLTGKTTTGGVDIIGTDSVRTVPPKGKK